ncbi:hypothetical protein [Paraconexibacter antarcticus]|nr:hypothetical protein [Paraconexibacter antarcticus]
MDLQVARYDHARRIRVAPPPLAQLARDPSPDLRPWSATRRRT